eukprot:2113309-Pyramimonas_sp.AAC.1
MCGEKASTRQVTSFFPWIALARSAPARETSPKMELMPDLVEFGFEARTETRSRQAGRSLSSTRCWTSTATRYSTPRRRSCRAMRRERSGASASSRGTASICTSRLMTRGWRSTPAEDE